MVTQKTYKQWWQAMDACNSSGLIHAFPKVVDEIWEEARERSQGTAYVNSHPLVIIFARKLLDLAAKNPYNMEMAEELVKVKATEK